MDLLALREDTHSARMDALQGAGIPYLQAERLSREHDLERIQQAIEHRAAAAEQQSKSIGPFWLIHCLDDDWLATILFPQDPPMNQWGIDRRAALKTNGMGDLIRKIDDAVRGLGFWEWRFLAEKALRILEDDIYRRTFFRNPTKSNWHLCEMVYNLWKRNALASQEFKNYLSNRQPRNPPDTQPPK